MVVSCSSDDLLRRLSTASNVLPASVQFRSGCSSLHRCFSFWIRFMLSGQRPLKCIPTAEQIVLRCSGDICLCVYLSITISETVIAIATGDLTPYEISVHAGVAWLVQKPFIKCEIESDPSNDRSSTSMPWAIKKVEALAAKSLVKQSCIFKMTRATSTELLSGGDPPIEHTSLSYCLERAHNLTFISAPTVARWQGLTCRVQWVHQSRSIIT